MARKFTLYPDDGTNNNQPVILGDDTAGDKISGDLPEQERSLQAAPGFRASFQKLFARLNRINQVTWRVDRDHGSEDVAVKFKRSHADEVPLSGVLEDSGTGLATQYLTNAIIVGVRCISHDGQSTVFEYSARGGAITNTNPNT